MIMRLIAAMVRLHALVRAGRRAAAPAATITTNWPRLVLVVIVLTIASVAGVKWYPILVAYSAEAVLASEEAELASEEARNKALLLAKKNQELLEQQQKLAARQSKQSAPVFTPVFGQVFTSAPPKKTQAQTNQKASKLCWETRLSQLRKEKIDLENRLKRLGLKDPSKTRKEIVDFVEELGSDYKDAYDKLLEKQRALVTRYETDKQLLAKYTKEGAEAVRIRSQVWFVDRGNDRLRDIKNQISELPIANRKAIRDTQQKIGKVEREIKIAEDTITKIGSS